jgi:hypothetical protein
MGLNLGLIGDLWETKKGRTMKDKKSYGFYKKFYDENRVALLQYESLRKNFHKMVNDVLGEYYYNMAMDVYDCDRICCEDIIKKTRGFWKRLFG